MKTRRFYLIGVGIVLAVLTFSFFLIPSASAGKITLKASTHIPIKHRLVEDALSVWGKEIEKRTNGQVEILWFHSSTLVPIT